MRLRDRSASAAPNQVKDDTAVILVWLPGGPSQFETYDMKPDAPLEYRGLFHPIRTNVPGMDVCELLPRHAQIADKYNIIRSISHEYPGHAGGHRRFLTGYRINEPVDLGSFVNDHPMVGSVVAKRRERVKAGVPNYISEVDNGREGVDTFSFGPAYLGGATAPFTIVGDPSTPGFKVQNFSLAPEVADRLDHRSQLLTGFDRLRREVDKGHLMGTMDKFNQQAMELLMSDKCRTAFDLSHEPEALRSRYGHHRFGQRAILARRLVEAGASFVTVVMEHPGGEAPKYGVYNWDSHAVNCHLFDDARWRFPYYDQAVSALIEDLHARGLQKRVLLIVTGEFGRTPRINPAIGTQTGVMQPGRDHWSNSMSLLVSGGGMRTGQVIGSTDAKGEAPKDRPLTPEDLWATVYRHLGMDPTESFLDHSGRPLPILPGGQPIEELLGA